MALVSGLLMGTADAAPTVAEVSREIDGVLDSIGATPQQRSALRQIGVAALQDLRGSAPEAREVARGVVDAVSGRQVDRDALEDARVEAVDLLDQASKDLLPHAADAMDLLTPAQRRALADRVHAELGRWAPHI